jgi:serine/threonine protein kinase
MVIWMGSGLSREANMPSWAGLRDTLCIALEDAATHLEQYHERLSALDKAKRARQASDYWVAFEILKDAMGQTSYRSTTREAFVQADRCTIPEMYKLLWKLPVDGILNLNLDRLATRAHSETFGGRPVNEFCGRQANDHMHVLKSMVPFIVNLHGVVNDERSWILTNSEIKSLFRDMGYLSFIQSCILTKTVLFIGISPDDKAVNAHLDRLKAENIDFGSHYWVTNRADTATRNWAEAAGVRIIYYSADGDDHSELAQFCDDLIRFMPSDTVAPPVSMAASGEDPQTLLSPAQLRKEESEEVIRAILNSQAKKILERQDEGAYEAYNDFCKAYDQAIYRAWYVTTEGPNNKLCGYTIREEIAEGAFGRVFRAEAPDGKEVALKLLKSDVRRKPEMMQSFRRGVRSMRILSQHNVEGMVPYREASEIPAFAVMDFIPGPNLRQAVESHYCEDWHTVLRVSVDLTHIVRRAHLLPERVLHRDIRPANIMLEGYYADPDDFRVVVLDFDLSWHMGATEVSVTDPSAVSGFLAPEQVTRKANASTRNAAVDSFGLGMTLFYLRTKREPKHLQHLHANWHETLIETILAYNCPRWHSLPIRYARLIENATRDAQSERWDMSQIEGELELLKEAETAPQLVQSAELLAEEIAARTAESLNIRGLYHWDADRIQAYISLPSGVCIHLVPRETQRRVAVDFSWSNTMMATFKKIHKYLPKARDKSLSDLQKVGWQTEDSAAMRTGDLDFGAEIPITHIQRDLATISSSLARAAREFRFD